MNHVLNNDQSSIPKYITSLSAGAIASFVTQPFQVMKTNMIASSSNYMKEIHKSIIKKGWSQYMRGSTLAVVRQAYGFTIYTNLIEIFNCKIQTQMPLLNKFFKYSLSAISAKYIAMIFESTINFNEDKIISQSKFNIYRLNKDNHGQSTQINKKGIGSTLAREGFYSLFHYNTYRLIKDDIFMDQFGLENTFMPAFFAGIVAITMSQPFQVVRSKLALSKINSFFQQSSYINIQIQRMEKFFVGYLPRLMRKPINSGICWTIIQNVKRVQQ